MNQLVYHKTQEISFALIRVASHMRRFTLRTKIEGLAYHLLENITYRNYELTLHTIDSIQGFLDLAKNIYELEARNHEILTRELLILTHEVQELSGEFSVGNIENLFTKVESLRPNQQKEEKRQLEYGNTAKKPIELPQKKTDSPKKTNKRESPLTPGVEERKKAIINMIQAFPGQKAQLKDITARFSQVSERTLRYDLKNLIEAGELERIGSGPSSFYALKNQSVGTAIMKV